MIDVDRPARKDALPTSRIAANCHLRHLPAAWSALASPARMDAPMSERRRLDIPGQSDMEDRLLAMVTALASELAVTRERLDTVERLLEETTLIQREQIEAFAPTIEANTERDAMRRRLIDRIFRPIREAAQRARQEQEG